MTKIPRDMTRYLLCIVISIAVWIFHTLFCCLLYWIFFIFRYASSGNLSFLKRIFRVLAFVLWFSAWWICIWWTDHIKQHLSHSVDVSESHTTISLLTYNCIVFHCSILQLLIDVKKEFTFLHVFNLQCFIMSPTHSETQCPHTERWGGALCPEVFHLLICQVIWQWLEVGSVDYELLLVSQLDLNL